MALIKNNWEGPGGVTHEAAYVCVHTYTNRVIDQHARVLLHWYASAETKDARRHPVHKEWFSLSGEDYQGVFGESEGAILGIIYKLLTSQEREDNDAYKDMTDSFEKMKVDKEELELENGDEISRSIAKEAEFMIDVDFEVVSDLA